MKLSLCDLIWGCCATCQSCHRDGSTLVQSFACGPTSQPPRDSSHCDITVIINCCCISLSHLQQQQGPNLTSVEDSSFMTQAKPLLFSCQNAPPTRRSQSSRSAAFSQHELCYKCRRFRRTLSEALPADGKLYCVQNQLYVTIP